MQVTKGHWAVAAMGLVVAVAVAAYVIQTRVPAPQTNATDALITASSTVPFDGNTPTGQATTTTNIVPRPFPINASDAIASWSFKGAYSGNDTLIAQANADSAHLEGLLGKGQYDDYDLYLGIGNDNNLMGDGKVAYQYFNRSISIHPQKGLAYANLAHLMDELGAYYTAADAYAKAVAVEPGMLEYHIERLTYLTRQFPKDNARISAALADAEKQFGDNASILAIEARWLSDQGRYADAIKAWETVKTLSPGKDMTAVDAEIARLQTKQ